MLRQLVSCLEQGLVLKNKHSHCAALASQMPGRLHSVFSAHLRKGTLSYLHTENILLS